MQKGQGKKKLSNSGSDQEMVVIVQWSVAKFSNATVQVNLCCLSPATLGIGTKFIRILPETDNYNFFKVG